MARTQVRITAARERGVTFGRRPKLNERQKVLLAERHAAGATVRELAEEFRVAIGTVHAAIRPTTIRSL
jgi:DNA invertase Pin-like site-specific DNA recombinase